jgi:hypothetical protein
MSQISSKRSSTSYILPENFFENLLILEMQLKREFTMETLQEVIGLYTVKLQRLTFRSQSNTMKVQRILNTEITKIE